jgi:hypothetical protein
MAVTILNFVLANTKESRLACTGACLSDRDKNRKC